MCNALKKRYWQCGIKLFLDQARASLDDLIPVCWDMVYPSLSGRASATSVASFSKCVFMSVLLAVPPAGGDDAGPRISTARPTVRLSIYFRTKKFSLPAKPEGDLLSALTENNKSKYPNRGSR